MKTRVERRLGSLFSVFIAVVLLFTATAYASGNTQVTRSGSLQGSYLPGGKAVEDVEFSIYKVADFKGGIHFEWNEQFSGYNITMPDLSDSDGVAALKETVSGYIARDSIGAINTATTDSTGIFTFSDLDMGMYVILGNDCTIDSHIYTPTPVLITFPFTSSEGYVGFDADLEVKYTVSDVPMVPTSRHVMKVWSGGSEDDRPASVSVQLLKGEEVYDEQVLNVENNWRYTWEGLDSKEHWAVVETNPAPGYTTSVYTDGTTTVVTNTYVEPEIPEVPDTPSTPEPTPSDPGPSTSPRPSAPVPVPTPTPVVVPETPVNPDPLTPIMNAETPTEQFNEDPTILSEMPDIPSPQPDEIPVESPVPSEEPMPSEQPSEEPSEIIPEEPSTPVETPEDPTEEEEIIDPQVPLDSKIPQTGQDWLPVWVLSICGCLLILAGIVLPKKEHGGEVK